MISVVIPTLWRASELLDNLITLNACASIHEIIIINNDQQAKNIDLSLYPKVKTITPEQNLYITASWNQGVAHSESNIVCLLNDDVFLPCRAYKWVLDNWPTDAGIIGLSLSNPEGKNYHLLKASGRGYGFGACMFIKKSNYQPIPEDLRLWYNDDWLFKYTPGQHYYLLGHVRARMSVTTGSHEFSEIKKQDEINWRKYE